MTSSTIASLHDPAKSLTSAPALSAHDISVSYQDHAVFKGLSLDIAPGQITALCGPNGCGKSTLLRSLAGLQPITEGTISVKGRPLASYKRRELAQTLTMLAQFNQIPEGLTVAELVAYGRYAFGSIFSGPSNADRAAVMDALIATGLQDYADRQVTALSGGERQRAWVAMALAQECEILLLDEPTTYLDIHHQIDVLRELRRLNRERGLTIVWVLHELNQAAAFSDHIVLMRGGRILHQGTPDAMIDPVCLSETFGLPMMRLNHPESGEPVCLPSYRSTEETRPISTATVAVNAPKDKLKSGLKNRIKDSTSAYAA
ncbi:ABC transporter ATP-binding protein [Glaciimonas sp. CA11.2]|uniref:ABC transporter ATP-binding protein n=1 Tax=unclassified Glaciimonas TaxID=2644401 RepID=UPI002AB582F7|nr:MULTISPECIES: ABC transporter ATP-binding protein [unclassified Glaciimonas]MDY7547445.1 ABC transporter ATP-binding protein [Glaciimonas sp. CA11.2]MEB0013540.1 ABC transporter ATP-binding protein [Glaciimonas sp. Cout2]MEB0084656.1 ABC transporter ATP-binding protein [Glaciimonas sp. Gout2]MEB0162774.1 ABC transporter ATP-binding protein [Glaciimonas sp. CA11.2]